MPRACPVEIHVRRYTDFAQPAKLDATGQARGISRTVVQSWVTEFIVVESLSGIHCEHVPTDERLAYLNEENSSDSRSICRVGVPADGPVHG
jgi:hypothetical protein